MQDLIKLAQSGDQKAIAQVFEANAGVITAIIKRYGRNVEYRFWDDIMGEGYYGFMLAIKSYRPDKGAQFMTWASRCMEGAINNYIRGQIRHQNKTQMNYSEWETLDGADFLGVECKPDDPFAEGKIGEERAGLSQREEEVFSRHFEGETYMDIGQSLGVSKQRIEQIDKRAKKKLRKGLKKLKNEILGG